MSLSSTPAGARVRAALAAADRRRRGRLASVRLWRAAPAAALAALAAVVVCRALGWPVAAPLTLVAGALLGLAAYWAAARRPRGVSDAVARAIDADAGLGGELRSAGWFAQQPDRDAWADLHVERAAVRTAEIDWRLLYPPVRALRARVATSLLLAAALAVALGLPGRAQPPAPAASDEPDAGTPAVPVATLTPEQQQLLDELLKAAAAGTLQMDERRAAAADVQALLAGLREVRERAALEQLARAMSDDGRQASADADAELRELAERLRKALGHEPGSAEFRDAIEQLARRLSDAADDEAAAADAAAGRDDAAGDRARTSAQELDEGAFQMVREAQPAAGAAGAVMMASPGSPDGAAMPGSGVGGSGSGTGAPQAAALTAIERALRQELVEASQDSGGAQVETEIRRDTEQGRAATAYTGAAARPAAGGHAAARPALPETRRADVQRYFIRTP